MAFAGRSSICLDRLVRSGSQQTGLGSATRLPIFDAGRLRAPLRGKTADLDAAIESYNATLLEAVHEAADQIGSLRSIDHQPAEQAYTMAVTDMFHVSAVLFFVLLVLVWFA